MENGASICNLDFFSKSFGGRKEMMLELIDVFTVQSKEEIDALDAAIQSEDFEKISKIAHSMKSTVSIVGSKVISNLLIDIQVISNESRDLEKLNERMLQLKETHKKCILELQLERDKYQHV